MVNLVKNCKIFRMIEFLFIYFSVLYLPLSALRVGGGGGIITFIVILDRHRDWQYEVLLNVN